MFLYFQTTLNVQTFANWCFFVYFKPTHNVRTYVNLRKDISLINQYFNAYWSFLINDSSNQIAGFVRSQKDSVPAGKAVLSPELDSPSCQFKSPFSQKLQRLKENFSSHTMTTVRCEMTCCESYLYGVKPKEFVFHEFL